MDWLSQLYNPGRLRFTQALQDEYRQAILRRYAAMQEHKLDNPVTRADMLNQGIANDAMPPSYLLRYLSNLPGSADRAPKLQGNPWNEQAPMLNPRNPWDWLKAREVRG